MPGASDIRAGRAFVELYADNNALSKGLTQAAGMLKVFGGAITAVGASFAKMGLVGVTSGMAGLTALFGATVKFGSMGDELDKMSKRTGVAVEELSMLKYAATQSGSSLEEVEVVLRRMQRALSTAADAEKLIFSSGKGGMTLGANDPFSRIGLSAQALAQMNPAQAFQQLGTTLNALGPQSAKVGEFMKVFGFHGQGGTKMIPMFMDMVRLMGEAQRMGAIWTKEDVDAAVKFEYALKGLKFQLARVIDMIGLSLAPVLTDLIEQTQRPLKAAMDWIRGNQQLVVSLFQVGIQAVVLSAKVLAIGTAIYAVGKTLMIVATGFKIIGALIGFLITPLGIVTSLLVGGVAAWAYFTDAGQRAMEGLKAGFQNATDAMKDAWKGMWNALQAGDITLAGKIAFQGLLISWLEIIDSMKRAWNEFAFSIKLPEAQSATANFLAKAGSKAPLVGMGPSFLFRQMLGFPGGGAASTLDQMEQERLARVKVGLEGPNAVDPRLKVAREQLDNLNKEAQDKLIGSVIGGVIAAGLRPGAAIGGAGLQGIGEGSLGTFNPFTAQRFPGGGTQDILKQSLDAQQRTADAVEWIRANPSAMMVI